MRCCWVLALIGCGRLGFDPLGDNGDGGVTDGDAAPAQVAYIKASNTETFDDFGYAIALSADGTTLAVGAPQEDSASSETDNSASNAGAVYIFVRAGQAWTQEAYLKPANIDAGDLFGAALALSADGDTLVATAVGEDSSTVGIDSVPDDLAERAGAAYIFVRSGQAWSQQAYIKASNTDDGDHFGQAAAISASGDVVAIGAELEDSSATGVDGDGTNDGTLRSGAVYVYTRTGTTWTQDAYVKASNTGSDDNFGYALALSADGATLAVGAPAEDSGSLDQADDAVTDAGAAYVFTRGATWTQQVYLKAAAPMFGDYFARRMSLSANGTVLLCAGPGDDSDVANSGAAFVAARDGATWLGQAMLKASNAGDADQFGSDVALSGDGRTLLVGALAEDAPDDASADSGAAYAFTRDEAWTQSRYIKPAAVGPGDNFGWAVAISSDARTQAASLPGDDSSATGVNGNADDASAPESGAVIVTFY